MQSFDVVIVGGGIVGLVAALGMQQKRCSVAVIDGGKIPLETISSNPRVYAINEASISLLRQLNVWQHIDVKRLSPYEQMEIWDAKSGASMHFDASMMAALQLGYILEESAIREALLTAIESSEIQIFPEMVVDRVEQDTTGIQVYSKDKVWNGQLLMVTDGAHSSTRESLKVPLTCWSYHQEALVAKVQTEFSHQKTAYQVFNKDGPLAFLPLTDENQCSIVWTTTPEKALYLQELPEASFNESLTQAFAARLGKTELQSPVTRFPLTMRHAQQYAGRNWLLLGDAAHTIHPMAGLGLNLGLADVSDFLASFSGLPVSSRIMGAWQRRRKHETWQLILLLEGLKKLFGSDFSPVVRLRSFGLRMCDGLMPLKNGLIAHAMGRKSF